MNTYFVHYKYNATGFTHLLGENNIVIDFKSDILTTEDIREFESIIINKVFGTWQPKVKEKIRLTICNFKKLK